MADARHEMSVLTTQLNDCAAQMEKFKADAASKTAQLKAKVSQIQTLDAKVGTLDASIAKFEMQIVQLSEENNGLKTKAKDLCEADASVTTTDMYAIV